jgi:hypothetical protein
LTERRAAEFESAREKPDVIEISHPAVRNAKHHHRLKLFGYDSLTTIGSQVKRRKPKNCGKFDVLRWRSDGVPKTDVHLNLDTSPLQVGYQNNPHATIFDLFADLISFDSLGRKAKTVRLDLNGANVAEDPFEPLDTAVAASKQESFDSVTCKENSEVVSALFGEIEKALSHRCGKVSNVPGAHAIASR